MLNIAKLYQAIIDALPPWPYGPAVQRAYVVIERRVQ